MKKILLTNISALAFSTLSVFGASSSTLVELPKMPWPESQERLTSLIKKTIADPTYEKREFRVDVLGEDFESFCTWEDSISSQLTYPVSMSFSNEKAGEKKPCGFPDCTLKITLTNYALREERSRQSEGDVCKFYGQPPSFRSNCSKEMNSDTFHNLLVRANLQPDELDKGKYDSREQTPIDVRPITLLSTTLEEATPEFQSFIESFLRKSMKKFVVLIFNLPPNAKFTVYDLYHHKIIKDMETAALFMPATTILENDEKRIYLLFRNTMRNTLDLHGLTRDKAKEKVIQFISEKYKNFDTDCFIITGQGKHSENSIPILKNILPEWLSELEKKEMIESHNFDEKNPGICDIVLPAPLTLENDPKNEIPEMLKQIMRAGGISAIRASSEQKGQFFIMLPYARNDKPHEIKGKKEVRIKSDGKHLPKAPAQKQNEGKKKYSEKKQK